jgi:hypothetical protein
MQVATQEKNTVVAQSRGYWGYEEIDSGKMEKIAGAGDGGDGGGCGCGDGDGDGGAAVGTASCSQGEDGTISCEGDFGTMNGNIGNINGNDGSVCVTDSSDNSFACF